MSGTSGPRRGSAMGDIHVIPDGALLISDGVIQHVGPSRRLEHLSEARNADEIDASGRVVMPAFVDCFTQLFCGPPRGAGEERDSERSGGDAFGASARVFRSWSPQRLELEARKHLRQMLRHGTTTAAGGSGYAQDEETELRVLRAMDRLHDGPVDLLPFLYTNTRAWRQESSGLFDTLELLATQLLPAAAHKRLVNGVVVGADGFPPGAVEGYLSCAAGLGLQAFVETTGEAAGMALQSGAAAVLDLSGLAPSEVPPFSQTHPMAVLLPGRTFHGGRSSFSPARALIDQGAAIALATGFDSLSSPTTSLPMVMALACTQMRMTAAEALTAVTVNAAHALGLGGKVGALQYGMRADVLLLDCGDYREIPLYFGMNPVAMVMRGGLTALPLALAAGHS